MASTNCYFIWYDNGIKNLSLNDIVSQDIKTALCTSTYVPNSDTHEFFDVDVTNELPTANGYTAGGLSLTTKTLTETATNGQFVFTSDNPQWAATPSDLVAHLVVFYNNTPATNKPILGYGFLNYNGGTPLDVTASAGTNLVISLPALGIFSTLKVNGV